MEPEPEEDRSTKLAGTGWAAQYHAHRQLLREEKTYRRHYVILTFTPMLYMGLNMATSIIIRYQGVAVGVSYSFVLLALMCWLIIKEGIFVHRRIKSVLRDHHAAPSNS